MRIFKLFMAGIKKIINMIKGGNQSMEDVAKNANTVIENITTIATVGAGAMVGIKKAQMSLVNVENNTKRIECGEDGLSPVTPVAKIVKNKNKHKKPYSSKSLELLERIAKTRNSHFRKLSPQEQVEVLRAEGFSVKEFLVKEKTNNKYRVDESENINFNTSNGINMTAIQEFNLEPIRFIRRKLGVPTKPLETKEVKQFYPLSNFYLTRINLPTMSDYFDLAEDIPKHGLCNNGDIDQYIKKDQIEPTKISRDVEMIMLDESTKHKTYKEYKKAVKKRMEKEGKMSIYQMMTDTMKVSKSDDDYEDKPKKKKSKKSADRSTYGYERDHEETKYDKMVAKRFAEIRKERESGGMLDYSTLRANLKGGNHKKKQRRF